MKSKRYTCKIVRVDHNVSCCRSNAAQVEGRAVNNNNPLNLQGDGTFAAFPGSVARKRRTLQEN